MFIGRNRCKHLALTLITVVHAIFVHFQIFSVVFFLFSNSHSTCVFQYDCR